MKKILELFYNTLPQTSVTPQIPKDTDWVRSDVNHFCYLESQFNSTMFFFCVFLFRSSTSQKQNYYLPIRLIWSLLGTAYTGLTEVPYWDGKKYDLNLNSDRKRKHHSLYSYLKGNHRRIKMYAFMESKYDNMWIFYEIFLHETTQQRMKYICLIKHVCFFFIKYQ